MSAVYPFLCMHKCYIRNKNEENHLLRCQISPMFGKERAGVTLAGTGQAVSHQSPPGCAEHPVACIRGLLIKVSQTAACVSPAQPQV